MDTRKLRQRAPKNLADARAAAKSYDAASDDGFELIQGDDRLKICGPFLVAAWELRPPMRSGGVEMATVYGYAVDADGTMRPVKFVTGGSGPLSIPGMLRQWADNGTNGDVMVELASDLRPGFIDDMTGEEVAPYHRYTFERPQDEQPDY